MSKRLPRVEIQIDQCKGCELCIISCPKAVLTLSPKINKLGYQYAEVKLEDACNGCDACFYACPEPGAICVIKEKRKAG